MSTNRYSTDPCTEASWGADPLETQGGFRALEYDAHAEFRSSLPNNGTVRWVRLQLDKVDTTANAAKASLTVSFPAVDWPFLQSIYGWAALQFQAWARGSITINADQSKPVVLYIDNVLEFWVDGRSYFGGDFYSYRRAPLILHLDPGYHRLDARLIRDVRAMGGTGEPNIQVRIEAHVSQGGLTVVEDKLLFPDIVDGKLASILASVPIRNEGSRWIHVLSIESVDVRMFAAQEAGRLLILTWRTFSLFHCSRMVTSVLHLGKQDHWLSMFRYVILWPSFSPLELSMSSPTFMENI